MYFKHRETPTYKAIPRCRLFGLGILLSSYVLDSLDFVIFFRPLIVKFSFLDGRAATTGRASVESDLTICVELGERVRMDKGVRRWMEA